MVAKKKSAKRVKKARRKSAAKATAPPRAAVAPAAQEPAPAQAVTASASASAETVNQAAIPTREFKFGGSVSLFAPDRPITGSDIERLKNEAGYDLNLIEASLGIASRLGYYKLSNKEASKPLPDISMAILMRLYEKFPNELLPFRPVHWAEYLNMIGVHPIEFAQLVGRDFAAGRLWQNGRRPIRSVQLIIEAFARAGVTHTGHRIYQAFVKAAKEEAALRGEKLEVKPPPTSKRTRRTRRLVDAEASMMTPVDD